MKLTDVEVFEIRAAGLPHHLREKLYPELTVRCSACDNIGDAHDATGEWRGVCTACNVSGEPRQPIDTAPADIEVIVFWLDPESPEHPECYDFDMLNDGCWRQWTDHYEWTHSEAPAGSRLPREQPPYTHWKPLGAPARAIDAARAGDGQ